MKKILFYLIIFLSSCSFEDPNESQRFSNLEQECNSGFDIVDEQPASLFDLTMSLNGETEDRKVEVSINTNEYTMAKEVHFTSYAIYYYRIIDYKIVVFLREPYDEIQVITPGDQSFGASFKVFCTDVLCRDGEYYAGNFSSIDYGSGDFKYSSTPSDVPFGYQDTNMVLKKFDFNFTFSNPNSSIPDITLTNASATGYFCK